MEKQCAQNIVNNMIVIKEYLCYIFLVAAGVGGIAAGVAAPYIIALLEFTSGGIAAGSYAASLMSALVPTAASGVVATLQSLPGAFGTGAVTTGSVSALWQWATSNDELEDFQNLCL